MSLREQYVRRAVTDFLDARKALAERQAADAADAVSLSAIDDIAAAVVIAARLEALEDTLTTGLPTAGRGI